MQEQLVQKYYFLKNKIENLGDETSKTQDEFFQVCSELFLQLLDDNKDLPERMKNN